MCVIDLNKLSAFEKACYHGDKEQIDKLFPNDKYEKNDGFEYVCMNGNRELVDYMIEKGATNFNLGLKEACGGGHRELVDYMKAKGATNDHYINSFCKCFNKKEDQKTSEVENIVSVSTDSETENISNLEKQRSEIDQKIEELNQEKEKIQKQIDQEEQIIQSKKQLEALLANHDKKTIIEWLLE